MRRTRWWEVGRRSCEWNVSMRRVSGRYIWRDLRVIQHPRREPRHVHDPREYFAFRRRLAGTRRFIE